jgi:acyl-coenzyme A thioesterase PaaI-like protein
MGNHVPLSPLRSCYRQSHFPIMMNPATEQQTSMHPLDAAIQLSALEPGHWNGHTSPAYGNMVGPVGGVTAAVLLNAAWISPERLGEPVALTVNFAGPIADGPFTIHTRILRTNRTTQHWSMELVQGPKVGASASAVFATKRDTWAATDARFPTIGATTERDPPIGSVRWTSAYHMRFAQSQPPSVASDPYDRASVSTLWLRDEPPRPLDFVSLAALCDAFYPRIFVRRPQRVPIGTVTLTTYFHADAAALAQQGARAVLGTARALHFGNGYFDQTAEVWSDQKTLLATSHQMVYFKE